MDTSGELSHSVTYADVLAARERIAGGIYQSPCTESILMSEQVNCRVWCKLDSLQHTGSFKERGARNALLLLSAQQRTRGVVAASAGNHALGLAYHGMLLKIPVTVVMPSFAPLIKITTCRQLGARVVLHGAGFADARARADEYSAREGLTYIHGYDDAAIIAGQGTMGLEILEQLPEVQAVVVPIGGAGLIAGLGLAIKTRRPDVQIFGVEPVNAATFTPALAAGHPVTITPAPTLADGLAVPQVGARAFAIARRFVDRVVTVTEDELALAILRVVELTKGVVEGAAAAPVAALLANRFPDLEGKNVVLTLCGGNIDPTILSRVIERGLVIDGRLCRFTAVISDRPGGLARFASLIGSTGASIQDIDHDRAFADSDISAVHVMCTVQTRDRQHVADVYRVLRENGFEVVARA